MTVGGPAAGAVNVQTAAFRGATAWTHLLLTRLAPLNVIRAKVGP
jgi:hypothetical protein